MNLSVKMKEISLSVDFNHKMVVYRTKNSNETLTKQN